MSTMLSDCVRPLSFSGLAIITSAVTITNFTNLLVFFEIFICYLLFCVAPLGVLLPDPLPLFWPPPVDADAFLCANT